MTGGVTEALADPDAAVWHQEADLSDPGAPSRLIESAAATSGFLDILVCNHARSGGDGPLGPLTAEMLDAHWAVNARARSCWPRPSPPSTTTAAPAAGSSS